MAKSSGIDNVLQEGTVVLDVTFHLPMLTKHERTKKVETLGNQNWFSISKRIANSKAYNRMCGLSMDTRAWIMRRMLPCRITRRGVYLIPVKLLPNVLEHLDEVEREYTSLADQFVAEYEQCKEDAKEQLQDAYNEQNYQSAAAMRAACWVEKRVFEMTLPTESKVGKELASVELQKARETWNKAAQDVTWALRQQFADLVSTLTERLTIQPDGSKRKLTDKTVDSMVEWIELFSKRNLLGDAELTKLASQTIDILKGKDAESIRSSDRLRERMAGEFSKLKTTIDEMLVDAPSRQISFEDEE